MDGKEHQWKRENNSERKDNKEYSDKWGRDISSHN